jgi:preprotein translocase subunit SecG
MFILLTIVHVVVCIFLIIVVLLQSGKAADLAGAFGGMGSQTAFGPRGSATLLSKATTVSAVIFMFTSLALSIMATRTGGTDLGSTVLEKAGQTQTAPAKSGQPAAPAPAAPGGQPSVTYEVNGQKKTVPLQIPKDLPKNGQAVPVQSAPAQSAPAQSAPAQSAPANKK